MLHSLVLLSTHAASILRRAQSQIGRGQAMVNNFAAVVANAQTDALPAIPSGISGLQRDRRRGRLHESVEERDGELRWRKEQLVQQPSFVAASHALNTLLMPGMAGRAVSLAKEAAAPVLAPLADGASSALSGVSKLLRVLLTVAAARQQLAAQQARAELPPAFQQAQAQAPYWLGPAGT